MKSIKIVRKNTKENSTYEKSVKLNKSLSS